MNAYPVAGKQKSFDLCRAFLDGAGGGKIVTDGRLRPGAAVFYGVNDSNENVWRQVLAEKRDFFYIDNSYFDAVRAGVQLDHQADHQFRVTRNGYQCLPQGQQTDGTRFAALGIEIKPWRMHGDAVVLCPQSDHFMRVVVRAGRHWVADTIAKLTYARADLRIVVREWSSDKRALAATLIEDLNEAAFLVTWSSAAAVTALLHGVPAVSLGVSAASGLVPPRVLIEPMQSGWLPTDAERLRWAGVLADNQWTVSEIKRGMAWQKLNG